MLEVNTSRVLADLAYLAKGFDHPEGVCVDPAGQIYCGGEAGQIYRVTGTGGQVVAHLPGFVLGLAADADGRIFAIDAGERCIWIVDPNTGVFSAFSTGGGARSDFITPNFGCFGPDGSYYLSDSGIWGERNGRIWVIKPCEGPDSVLTSEVRNFPNGVCLSPDAESLYVVESLPPALCEVNLASKTRPAPHRTLCRLPGIVPDGLTLCSDGSVIVSCYRPDALIRWSHTDGLEVIAQDPHGTLLVAPTNAAFYGPSRSNLAVANLEGWHLTDVRGHGLEGARLHYPTASQLAF